MGVFCKAEGSFLGGYDDEKMISFVCGNFSQLGFFFQEVGENI